jgi:F0F1-type ATP synthase assembly protein I
MGGDRQIGGVTMSAKFIGIGILIGVVVGVVIENLAMGIAIGVAIGIAIGMAKDWKGREPVEDEKSL